MTQTKIMHGVWAGALSEHAYVLHPPVWHLLQATESTGHCLRPRMCFILLSDTSCRPLIAPFETANVLHSPV